MTDAIELASSEALAGSQLRRVTAKDETTIVLLAGPVGCGKTTIAIALYELFNSGPVGGLNFAGSETLVGFERICHAGREGSGLSTASTIRTNPSSGATFLHIRAAENGLEGTTTHSLLVSDVTGEAFDEARDVAEPKVMPRALWKRADVICIVLDGGKMTQLTKRQVVQQGARSLLRAARESGMLSPSCRLSVVTSKWDLVDSAEARDFVSETETMIKSQFAKDFLSISTHRVAARPITPETPYGFGIPSLLVDWITRRPRAVPLSAPRPKRRRGLGGFISAWWRTHATSVAGAFDVVE